VCSSRGVNQNKDHKLHLINYEEVPVVERQCRTKLTNLWHVFKPKLGIDFKLGKAFRTSNLDNNAGTRRASRHDTGIWFLLSLAKILF